MAHESPLFQSSLELLGHSITHFNGSTELDRKLVILHLANAVELMLKDLMLDQGLSIYKNPKETITLNGAVAALREQDVELPVFHKVELMIDERNALQHRFGSPNELTTLFYTESTMEFFDGLLASYYDLNLDEILPQFLPERELAAFRLRRPTNESELENLKKVAAVHPSGAMLAAYSYFERLIREFAAKISEDERARFRHPGFLTSHRYLERVGVEIGEALGESLDDVRQLRNMVAHGRKEPTRKEVASAVEAIEQFEQYLDQLESPEKLLEIRENRDRIEQERMERQLEAKERSAGFRPRGGQPSQLRESPKQAVPKGSSGEQEQDADDAEDS